MKKLLLIIPILVISACTVYQPVEITGPTYNITSGYIDYKKYSDDGFYLTTSNSVSFNHTPIGEVGVNESSGYVQQPVKLDLPKARELSKKEKRKIDNVYGIQIKEEEAKYTKGTIKEATAESVLGLLVEEAKTRGANGIVDLKIIRIKNDYSASGMAIKLN